MTEAQAKETILRMLARFPGFIEDSDVSGADLVDFWCNELSEFGMI